MITMWRVPTSVGRVSWGQTYYGLDILNRIHTVEAAGDRWCDHWHGGMGFLVQHTAFSLVFERSLQAVNPAVALPYWDFTIDGQQIVDEYTQHKNARTQSHTRYGGTHTHY